MVGYLALELWDAVHSWHNLDNATQNFCLTFTHLAGLIKVMRNMKTELKKLNSIFQICNLIWRRGKLLNALDLLKYMRTTFAVTREQVYLIYEFQYSKFLYKVYQV